MKTVKSFTNMVERLVEKNARLGMKLMLGDKILTCVEIKEDSYGKRYMFDNGLGFTKSNMASNIVKCQLDKKPWRVF